MRWSPRSSFSSRSAVPYQQQNAETLNKNPEAARKLDKATYETWRTLSENDTPYRFAVLTGHPRSGTTLVEQVLDSHDELISADEFDVFSQWIHKPIVRKFPFETPMLTVLDHVPPAVRQQARATYWQQTEAIFDEPIGERMLLDKNPGMMIFMPFVNWAFPEMKMLIALRDPRDVVLSCFMQKVPLTPISSNWLSLAGRGRVLRPRDEDVAQGSRADDQPMARISLRGCRGRTWRSKPARSWSSSACPGTTRC